MYMYMLESVLFSFILLGDQNFSRQSDLKILESGESEVYNAAHNLLLLLYERDCRRPYAEKDHWLHRLVLVG